jgi:hypothetical protein
LHHQENGGSDASVRLLTNLPVLLGEGKFTERLGFKSQTKQNQNPSFLGASEKRGVCNQSDGGSDASVFV